MQVLLNRRTNIFPESRRTIKQQEWLFLLHRLEIPAKGLECAGVTLSPKTGKGWGDGKGEEERVGTVFCAVVSGF